MELNMYNLAAPTSPNDQSAPYSDLHSGKHKEFKHSTTGRAGTECVLHLSPPAAVGMILFGMFGMFPVVLTL